MIQKETTLFCKTAEVFSNSLRPPLANDLDEKENGPFDEPLIELNAPALPLSSAMEPPPRFAESTPLPRKEPEEDALDPTVEPGIVVKSYTLKIRRLLTPAGGVTRPESGGGTIGGIGRNETNARKSE